MADSAKYKVKFRRRREGKTDYSKRLKLAKSGKFRLVIRLTSKLVIAQIIEYKPEGDMTLVNTTSLELKKYSWKGNTSNTPAAYLTGILIARKAQKKGIKEAVADIGLKTPTKGAKVFAVVKGAIDGGLEIPSKDTLFPSKERIFGEMIEKYKNVKLNVEEIKNKLMKV